MATRQSRKKKSDQAPQSYFGFSLQLNRAFLHLHRAKPGDIVALEDLDDVAVIKPSGHVLLEQVTSSIDGNPVSPDRSPKVWKTFANWVRGVCDSRYSPTDTGFHLYVLQSVKPGSLIRSFDQAKTLAHAQGAINAARATFWGAAPHFRKRRSLPDALREHMDTLFSVDPKRLAGIILNFRLHIGEGDPVKPIIDELSALPFGPKRIDHFCRYALGDLQTRYQQLLSAKQCARISFDIYRNLCRAYMEDFYSPYRLSNFCDSPSDADCQSLLLQSPVFTKQLDLIGWNNDDKISAVTDYLWASRIKTDWSESAEITERTLAAHDRDLNDIWALHERKLRFRTDLTPEQRGNELIASCLSTDRTL